MVERTFRLSIPQIKLVVTNALRYVTINHFSFCDAENGIIALGNILSRIPITYVAGNLKPVIDIGRSPEDESTSFKAKKPDFP
jgi:hypothetical protein